MVERCEFCKFWEFRDKQLNSGYCRRHAPCSVLRNDQEDEVDYAHRCKWPWTSKDDWCGDFKQKGPKCSNTSA